MVDLYTAEVLELLTDYGRLPQPGIDNFKVVITASMARIYKRTGRADFVDRMATGGRGISTVTLESNRSNWVVMLRDSLRRDYEKKGVTPTAQDAWSWSMWKGYLKDIAPEFLGWLGDSQPRHIRTSGHASPADLRAFAPAVAPDKLVPIHSFTWDENTEGFPPVMAAVIRISFSVAAPQ